MRAMVTGGAGFIGSNLVDRLLAEGHEVDVVDDLSTGSLGNLAEARASGGALRFHNLDVRSADLVDLVHHRRPEVIFHLAAQADVRVSVERPVFDAEVNVLGTIQVLEGARTAGSVKVVFAASGAPSTASRTPPTSPSTSISLTGRSLLTGCPRSPPSTTSLPTVSCTVEFTALALANVYGPRQDPHGEAGWSPSSPATSSPKARA